MCEDSVWHLDAGLSQKCQKLCRSSGTSPTPSYLAGRCQTLGLVAVDEFWFVQFRISALIFLGLFLQTSIVSAQIENTHDYTPDLPPNNIRQYLMTQATEISRESLANISSLDQWRTKRSENQRKLSEMLGLETYPVFEERTPVPVTFTDTIRQDGFSIVKLYYESAENLFVPANLYIPDHLTKPAPAILYVCGHAHDQKSHYQAHARNFAQNGFVTLLIETIQRGEVKGVHLGQYERGWFHWYNRGYNPAGVEAWNGIRAIDLLTSLSEVDAKNIGVTGISGGGSQSWYLGAMDNRIKATAAVAGAGSLEGQICNRTIDDHCDCMMPINTYQWDFTDIGALIAPRPFLIAQTTGDGYYSIESVRELHQGVERIYKLYGAEESLDMIEAPGGHSYGAHDEMREQILSFFLENLMGVVKTPDEVGPVDVTEVLSEESLLVYNHHPPETDRTKTIQETFVPLAKPPTIHTEAELDQDRSEVVDFLKIKTFAAFPKDPVPLDIRKGFSSQDFGRFGREMYRFVPEKGWRLQVRITRSAHPDTVKAPLLLMLNSPGNQSQKLNHSIRNVRQNMNIARFDARGIGETGWDPQLNWHIRRSAAWTGRTLASMRVYDVLRCLEMLRQTPGVDPDQIYLAAQGEMGAVAAYAALLDGQIVGLILQDPPASQNLPDNENSQRNAPDYTSGIEMLSCLQVTDLPQVVGLQYPKRVTILGDLPNSFEWVEELYSRLGQDDHFHVTDELKEEILR